MKGWQACLACLSLNSRPSYLSNSPRSLLLSRNLGLSTFTVSASCEAIPIPRPELIRYFLSWTEDFGAPVGEHLTTVVLSKFCVRSLAVIPGPGLKLASATLPLKDPPAGPPNVLHTLRSFIIPVFPVQPCLPRSTVIVAVLAQPPTYWPVAGCSGILRLGKDIREGEEAEKSDCGSLERHHGKLSFSLSYTRVAVR